MIALLLNNLAQGDVQLAIAMSITITVGIITIAFFSIMYGHSRVQEEIVKSAIEFYLPSSKELTFKIFDCESIVIKR